MQVLHVTFICLKVKVLVIQLCLTIRISVDCSPSGSSFYGIFQARILEWVAIFFSRRSFPPRNWTSVSHISGRLFTIWATKEAWQAWINASEVHGAKPWGCGHRRQPWWSTCSAPAHLGELCLCGACGRRWGHLHVRGAPSYQHCHCPGPQLFTQKWLFSKALTFKKKCLLVLPQKKKRVLSLGCNIWPKIIQDKFWVILGDVQFLSVTRNFLRGLPIGLIYAFIFSLPLIHWAK